METTKLRLIGMVKSIANDFRFWVYRHEEEISSVMVSALLLSIAIHTVSFLAVSDKMPFPDYIQLYDVWSIKGFETAPLIYFALFISFKYLVVIGVLSFIACVKELLMIIVNYLRSKWREQVEQYPDRKHKL